MCRGKVPTPIAERPLGVDPIEHGANHVEARAEIRAAHTEEDANGFANNRGACRGEREQAEANDEGLVNT
jgi:hypothetical protein